MKFWFQQLMLLVLVALACADSPSRLMAESQQASGYVYDDQNANGTRDANEPGLPQVRVSNGRTVVETDPTGRYQLPVDNDTIVFVIKPRGWMVPTDKN